MTPRTLALAALLPLTLLAACDDITRTTSSNPNAVVRFVNASTQVINATNADTLLTDNTELGFGGSTTCLTVSPSNPQLVFSDAATGAPIVFDANFSQGRQYTVIAYRDASGATKFANIDDTFRVASGEAGVNVFNAAPGSGNVVAQINGAPVGPSSGVAFGTASSFTSVPPGAQTVTVTNGSGSTTVLDTENLAFFIDVRSTIIIAPAGSGSGYHAFNVNSC
jgi:hypothetical protein